MATPALYGMTGRTVLITGGSGTFGSAATKALLATDVHRVRAYARGEHRLATLQELGDNRLRTFAGDVRDLDRLTLAMRGVDLVFHAAAMKRVERCEYDPLEAIHTNILGTENVVKAALDTGARVVFLSSDKACRPITHYGYTKAAAESLVLKANAYVGGRPRFSVMRYGNVSNSQGSVIPFWQRLAEEGRVLPITDLRMTRFWITIEEAVAFALWVADQPAGVIYVPKMPAYKLVDLAFAIQRCPTPLSVVGTRGVEKLHEDIVAPWEKQVVNPWGVPMSSDLAPDQLDVTTLQRYLEAL